MSFYDILEERWKVDELKRIIENETNGLKLLESPDTKEFEE